MVDFMVQLNWHVVWQAAIVMLTASVFCLVLRDRPSADHSDHRFWVWSFACISPMFIVPLTASAAAFQWPIYTKLLVWHWLLPQGFRPAPTLPQIPSSGIHWISVAYIAWLCFYFMRMVLKAAALRLWLKLNQASEYAWGPNERDVFYEVCRSFAVSPIPKVYQVEADITPFTFRWWQPAIVLPNDFFRGSSDCGEIRAVLAHEVAHIKHGHLDINMFLSLVVWLFPLSRLSLWRANRSLQQEMELVADIAAVQTGGADEWVLKRTLKRNIRERQLFPWTLGFAALVIRRLDRSLHVPLARSILHVWFVPVCAAISQLTFIVPPLAIAGPLVVASIAPEIVASLRPFTQAQPLYQSNYVYQIPVYQPPQMYIDPELLRPMRVPQIDFARFQIQMPRIDTQVLQYQYNPIPLIPYTFTPPPALSFTPMPSSSEATPNANVDQYTQIPVSSVATLPSPVFNPGIDTNALPPIALPAIPKSRP
jgi:Zn-dependent protease with chaperone function